MEPRQQLISQKQTLETSTRSARFWQLPRTDLDPQLAYQFKPFQICHLNYLLEYNTFFKFIFFILS